MQVFETSRGGIYYAILVRLLALQSDLTLIDWDITTKWDGQIVPEYFVRELDERLGLSPLITHSIMEDRRGKNTQLPPPDLLRQCIYSRLAGYEDLNDAERLSQDTPFR